MIEGRLVFEKRNGIVKKLFLTVLVLALSFAAVTAGPKPAEAQTIGKGESINIGYASVTFLDEAVIDGRGVVTFFGKDSGEVELPRKYTEMEIPNGTIIDRATGRLTIPEGKSIIVNTSVGEDTVEDPVEVSVTGAVTLDQHGDIRLHGTTVRTAYGRTVIRVPDGTLAEDGDIPMTASARFLYISVGSSGARITERGMAAVEAPPGTLIKIHPEGEIDVKLGHVHESSMGCGTAEFGVPAVLALLAVVKIRRRP